MILAANIAVEQEVIVVAIKIALFIFTCFCSGIHQHTFEKYLFFMSLNAMKCDCGSIFLRYLL